jgi:hypothetical protein
MADFNIIVGAFGLQGVREIRYSSANGATITKVDGYQLPPIPLEDSFAQNSGALDSLRTSILGTPVVSDLILESPQQMPLQGIDTVRFEAILLEVSQTKTIVGTAVVGRAGTIKEYICDGDYEITMRGAIVSEGYAFPEQAVRDFIKILLKPNAIKPISDFLRLFNIYSIVVTNYRFFQREGMNNIQFFEVSALSDAPEDIVLNAQANK